MNETYGEIMEPQGVVKPHQSSGLETDDDNLVLWVGNLDSRTTETMVYELFCQAGPILYIRLPKSPDGQSHKGYCFVTFQHEASVPYAINAMEGTTLFGKKLKLQPRPGSVHRKLMDQKKAEQRQEVYHQQAAPQQQAPIPQQQWFAHPQMAQVPPNMFLYQNQLYQSFNPNPNMNMNVMAIPFQPPQLPPGPFMQLPLQQTPPINGLQPTPQPAPPRGPGNYLSPRNPVIQNGFATGQYITSMPQQLRTSSPQQHQPGNPSHFNNHNGQAINGQAPPYHQPRSHYQNQRGPRPQRNGYNNGNTNNTTRMNYPQQGRMPPPSQPPTPQQPYLINPAFQSQTVQLVQSPDFRRTNPAPPTQAFPPGIPGQNFATPTANGFHVYHY